MNIDLNRLITVSDIRAINRAVLLELVRTQGPLSRRALAKMNQASPVTVNRILDELTENGWLQETATFHGKSKRADGLLKYDGSKHHVIGVDLGGTKIFGALADFDGKILNEVHIEHHQTQSEDSLQAIFQVIDKLVSVGKLNNIPVCGIGIGVPGIISPEMGVVSFAPALDWQNFPLKERLIDRYPYPVVVENDVNLSALGEAWFGVGGMKAKNLVLMAIGTGIGSGIVINGQIYSGAHQMAGEIGYLVLNPNQLGKRYRGFGAFEQEASGTGIAEKGRRELAGTNRLGQGNTLSTEDVFSAARSDAPWAKAIISETVDYLAQAIAAIALISDPEVVLIGGGVSRSADLFIEPVCKRLDGVIPILPKLEVSHLGYRAAVLGAVIQLQPIVMKGTD